MNRTTEKIPTWSLCYLINGDATALTDDEIRMVHPYFSHYPLFGLPTEVEDCEILYKNDNL